MSGARGIGVFASLPALGDVLSRGLPTDFADGRHGGLAGGLPAGDQFVLPLRDDVAPAAADPAPATVEEMS